MEDGSTKFERSVTSFTGVQTGFQTLATRQTIQIHVNVFPFRTNRHRPQWQRAYLIKACCLIEGVLRKCFLTGQTF